MIDVILVAIIGAILFAASWYIYKSKKNGVKCVGCPIASACSVKDLNVRTNGKTGPVGDATPACCASKQGGFRKTGQPRAQVQLQRTSL